MFGKHIFNIINILNRLQQKIMYLKSWNNHTKLIFSKFNAHINVHLLIGWLINLIKNNVGKKIIIKKFKWVDAYWRCGTQIFLRMTEAVSPTPGGTHLSSPGKMWSSRSSLSRARLQPPPYTFLLFMLSATRHN